MHACIPRTQEKELKLKLLLRISGTHDTPMWLSWYVVYLGTALWCAFMWWAAGTAFQFDAMQKTDFGV